MSCMTRLAATVTGDPDTPTSEVLLRTSEVAALLGVSRETVRRWCASNKIPHGRFPGGQIRVPESVVQAIRTSTLQDVA